MVLGTRGNATTQVTTVKINYYMCSLLEQKSLSLHCYYYYLLNLYYYSLFIIRFPTCLVLKRAKKSKNDLINAEEGEDHFTDISSVGKTQTQKIKKQVKKTETKCHKTHIRDGFMDFLFL